MGTDRVLLYARFDDSTKDFPVDTKFAQVGIIKNPEQFAGTGVTFTGNTFSSLFAVGLTTSRTVTIGERITQDQGTNVEARGYVALLIRKLISWNTIKIDLYVLVMKSIKRKV